MRFNLGAPKNREPLWIAHPTLPIIAPLSLLTLRAVYLCIISMVQISFKFSSFKAPLNKL